jgi:hypothetical protein
MAVHRRTVPLLSPRLRRYATPHHTTSYYITLNENEIKLTRTLGLLAIPHPSYPGLTYGLLFLIPGGGYPPLLTCLAWLSNNTPEDWKRAIALAIVIGMGNLGGTVGSNLFPEGHAPNYWMGYSICLGVTAAAIASTLVLKGVYERMNGERRVEGGDGEGSEDQEFRYVL